MNIIKRILCSLNFCNWVVISKHKDKCLVCGATRDEPLGFGRGALGNHDVRTNI